jgi:predicted phosphodiesterase
VRRLRLRVLNHLGTKNREGKSMLLRIYSDLHLGSPIEIKRKKLLEEFPRNNVLLLGDIVDLANCKKSETALYFKMLQDLTDEHRGNYIYGNHERMVPTDMYILGETFIAVHGDLQANPVKWKKYRSEPWGAGFFKRKFIIPFIHEAEEIIDRKPKADFLERAWEVARYHQKQIFICGHFHPDKTIDMMYKGIRIIIVPRGYTELDI